MVKEPLQSSSFSLDSSGVAGFFGGDEAVSAMGVVHLYAGRRWLGWYNAPGSYEIARKYGQLARSRFWDGLFSGPNVEPEELFELDGKNGPSYKGWHSGTHIPQTTHIGYLFLKECEAKEAEEVRGRKTTPYGVTIVNLETVDDIELQSSPLRTHAALIAAIPISASIAACVACGVVRDWYCLSMILLGLLCSGFATFIIGSGEVRFAHPIAAEGSPEGDGVMMDKTEVVILLGKENAVNSVTRGKFSLHFEPWFHRSSDDRQTANDDQPTNNDQPPKVLSSKDRETSKANETSNKRKYRGIGFCSLLLIAQFLAQLLLIPQGELFGQIMFLGSLAVSWGYNLYLSSIDKEVVQRRILMENVLKKPRMKKYILGTRTTMAVFLALMFNSKYLRNQSLESEQRKERLTKYLSDIIPNDTEVWRTWNESVANKILQGQPFSITEEIMIGKTEKDQNLLRNLYIDARTAQEGFSRYTEYDSEDIPASTEYPRL